MNENVENILRMTNGGYDVFVHYMGETCQKKMFKNPYREDTVASCNLYFHRTPDGNGRYYFHDFGDSEWRGDCFWFVGKIFNINSNTSFMEILRTIDKDLSLGVIPEKGFPSNERNNQKPIITPIKPMRYTYYPEPSSPLRFSPRYQNFMPKEIEYWKKYGITLLTLVKYQVKSLRYCSFTKSDDSTFNISSTAQNPIFGYVLNHGNGIKIYRPMSKNRFMYAGYLPQPYVFGFDELPRYGEVVYITGGEKDVLTLASHGFNAICLNSETASVPEDLINELTGRFHHIVFLYDCDETGKKESEKWVNEFKGLYPVSRLVLPLAGTKQEKDISDYFAQGHTSAEFQELVSLH